jgi:hypothetical protein
MHPQRKNVQLHGTHQTNKLGIRLKYVSKAGRPFSCWASSMNILYSAGTRLVGANGVSSFHQANVVVPEDRYRAIKAILDNYSNPYQEPS